jgi:hypothetical protein
MASLKRNIKDFASCVSVRILESDAKGKKNACYDICSIQLLREEMVNHPSAAGR